MKGCLLSLHRYVPCAMLAHIDHANIVDYFPEQNCSRAVGIWVNIAQVNRFVQRWHRHIKTTLYRLFSCKNMSVRSVPTLDKYIFFVQWLLFQINLGNLD